MTREEFQTWASLVADGSCFEWEMETASAAAANSRKAIEVGKFDPAAGSILLEVARLQQMVGRNLAALRLQVKSKKETTIAACANVSKGLYGGED